MFFKMRQEGILFKLGINRSRDNTSCCFLSVGKVNMKKRYSQESEQVRKWVRAQSLKPDYLGLYLAFTAYLVCKFKYGILSLPQFPHL